MSPHSSRHSIPNPASESTPNPSDRVTPDAIRTRKQRSGSVPIPVLTAYDYPLARLLDESGVDIVLVGDSLGMVVLGYPDTTLVTMEEMLHHTRAVARGVSRALIVADLPFHSYRTPTEAVVNARRLVEAGANAVKLEGGLIQKAKVEAIVQDGIPVMGHIGMLPQSVREEGGYHIKGRTDVDAARLAADGRALEEAGAFAVVLEIVTALTARRITDTLAIPTIGIGSGADCDGQVLVTHDLIGLYPWFVPKFVTQKAQVASGIREAVAGYVRDVTGIGEATPLP